VAYFVAFSAETIYDDWVVTFYNIAITSTPPFFYAIFEKDISEEVIMANPQMFKSVQSGKPFSYRGIFLFLLSAFWHSFVLFFAGYLLFRNDIITENGQIGGIWVIGDLIAFNGIFVVILKIALFTNYWNVITHIFMWGSLVAFLLLLLILSVMLAYWPSGFYLMFVLFQMPEFYFSFFVVVVICLLPDFLCAFVKRNQFPDAWQILQEQEKLQKSSEGKTVQLP